MKPKEKELSLDTASGHALHNVLTKEDEDQEQGEGDHRDGGHLDGDVGLSRHIRKGIAQTVGDEAHILGAGNQAGPYVRVPRAHHLQNGDGDEGRQGQGDHDLAEVLEVTRAVYLGGQIQLVGDLHEVLAEQVDVEHADQEGHDQNREAVDPAELGDGDVVGDGEELTGDHHGRQQSAEDGILALELQTGKGEGRENRDDQGEDGGDDTHEDGVEEQSAQVSGRKCLHVVAPHDLLGEQGGHGETVLHGGLQRGDDHPVEGEDHDDGHGDQEGVEQNLHENLDTLLLGGDLLQILFAESYLICHGWSPFISSGSSSCSHTG